MPPPTVPPLALALGLLFVGPDPHAQDSERRAVPQSGEFENFSLEEAVWFEVHVQLPEDLEAHDEPLALIAFEADLHGLAEVAAGIDLGDPRQTDPERAWCRRLVPEDGTARVPLPKGARMGGAVLQSRTLHAESAVLYAREGERPDPVRLRARPGVVLRGRLVPTDTAPAPAEFAAILHQEEDGYVSYWERWKHARRVRIEEGLEFETRALPAGERFELRLGHPRLIPADTPVRVEGASGEVLELSIPVEPGALVTGRVTAEHGRAVPGATLTVDGGSRSVVRVPDPSEAESGADGTFHLGPLPAGEHTLRVDRAGLVPRVLDLVLEPGEDLDDLVVELSSGGRVHGVVRWPDDSPAVGVFVEASVGSILGNTTVGSGRTDEHGRFAITGLDGRRYEIRVEAVPEGGHEPGPIDSFDTRQAEDLRDVHVASVTAKPADEPIELVLRRPELLRGRVVDDLGQPVSSFVIRAHRAGEFFVSALEHEVESDDGAFEMPGLSDGEWVLAFRARGHSPRTLRVRPPFGEPVHVELTDLDTVSGIVVDPDGRPVPGAEVAVLGVLSSLQRHFVETDDAGAFTLTRLEAGSRIEARHPDWASSPSVAASAAGRDDAERNLRLVLRRPATVSGTAVDGEGEPLAGQSVWLRYPGDLEPTAEGETDERGAFVFEGLAPGDARVGLTARPGEAEGSDDNVSRRVALVEGGSTSVAFRLEPRNPVSLRGRVVGTTGEAVGISFHRTDSSGERQSSTRAVVGPGGAYTAELPRPGSYVALVTSLGTPRGRTPFEVSIPDRREHELDFRLPGGAIRGRLVWADGAPVGGVPVELERLEGPAWPDAMTSARDGSFTRDHLHPGEYRVRIAAWAELLHQLDGAGACGAVVLGPILVKEAPTDLGEIVLEPAGALEGRITTATGEPVSGATVFVYDERGRLVSASPTCVSDGAGEFLYEGLSAGSYTVLAVDEERVAQARTDVPLATGGRTTVRMQAEPGGLLRVRCTRVSGATTITLSVVDEAGRRVDAIRPEASQDPLWSTAGGRWRIGPLVPGGYEVTAFAGEFRESRRVVLDAGESLDVELELP